jgi:PAS domain S-box-containing protein
MKAVDEPFKSDPLKMEEALNEIEAFNAVLLNFAPYPILITNLDGSVRYVNPALETLSGYSSPEVIGLKPPFPWWPPEIGLKYRVTSSNFLKTDIFEAERRFIRKNGETFWVILNVKEVIVNGQPPRLQPEGRPGVDRDEGASESYRS